MERPPLQGACSKASAADVSDLTGPHCAAMRLWLHSEGTQGASLPLPCLLCHGKGPSSRNKHVAAPAGDMPVALMFDGPSLGGFVCPCTITSTELWKMGQVSPNDSVLFKPVTLGERLSISLLHPIRCQSS